MRHWRILSALAFLLALMLGGVLPAAWAPAHAEDDLNSSYLMPFPENDTYRLVIFGDGPADGIPPALREGLTGDNKIDVQAKRRPLAGLTRPEFEDEIKAIADTIAREPLHIAVIYTGASDRQSMRVNGRWFKISSEEWRTEYGRRVDLLVKTLKKKRIGIYWIGLPIQKGALAAEEMQNINALIRDKTYLSGAKFIDTWTAFADQSGQYSAYGPDLAGKVRPLRDGDGGWFTQAGYQKLAHFAEVEIKRDIAAAKSERTVPLAGAEPEQRRINIGRALAEREGAGKSSDPRKAGVATASLEQSADNGKIVLKTLVPGNAISGPREEVQQIDIVRPMIPAAVIAHVARRESADKSTQLGETMAADIDSGLTVLNAVSTLGQTSPTLRRADPAAQSSYLKAIIKGEALTPKPGRADDFTWPRANTEPRS